MPTQQLQTQMSIRMCVGEEGERGWIWRSPSQHIGSDDMLGTSSYLVFKGV